MNNFVYHVPTKVYFGKGQISALKEIRQYGSKVLLCYGGGSIKKMGLYDAVMEILKSNGMEVFELCGIAPNPRIESVREGAAICKEKNVDVVLPIGGGSVLDCAKVVAAAALYDGDAWDLVIDPPKITKCLPIVTVLTLAATGSEMDSHAVISDMAKNEKWGCSTELFKPCMSILDPTYTFSVSQKQTAAGTADIMSHVFESYFTNVQGAYVQQGICETLLKTCIKYGPVAVREPDNYEARANLMWASSLAINGICSLGADVDWCVHPMEHELSAFYDITHGVGLAILTPNWMEYVLNEKTEHIFAAYGRNVWGIAQGDDRTIAKEAIAKTRAFFTALGIPATLTEVGIGREHFDIMAEKAANGFADPFVPLTKEDVIQIFERSL